MKENEIRVEEKEEEGEFILKKIDELELPDHIYQKLKPSILIMSQKEETPLIPQIHPPRIVFDNFPGSKNFGKIQNLVKKKIL